MKVLINIVALVFIIQGVTAQNTIDSVLRMIETNNTTLMAARKTTDAEKTANRIGLFLPNPEAEFAFLRADESQPVNRTDFSISQSFDFPTAYSYRSSISKLKNEQVELNYENEKRSVLLQARLICSELIYRNALNGELQRRLKHASELANAYSKMLDAGEANILEFNRAQLNLETLKSEIGVIDAERASLLVELAALNGGKTLAFTDSVFQPTLLNKQFEEWYNLVEITNTNILWLTRETDISAKQEKLNNALSLPRINAGYMSENIPGEKFRGITAGLSIPLWENRNTVKFAKARTSALQSMQLDQRLQLRNKFLALYERTADLQETVTTFRQRINEYNSEALLVKALNSGQISLSEYFLELSGYYAAVEKLLQMERELSLSYSELIQSQ